MIRFKEFFAEGISSILYHHTSVDKMLSILKDDKFRLGNDLGTMSDQKYKGAKFKPYFLSTSRVKYGGFARSTGSRVEQVNIVLDGSKLAQKYSGAPVDYWGPSFQKPTMDVEHRLTSNENEDRIFSAEPFIGPAHEYIKEIHVYLDKKFLLLRQDYESFKQLSDRDQEHAFRCGRAYGDLNKYADILGIPLFFYDDYEAYRVMNKKKTYNEINLTSNMVEAVVELFAKDDQTQLSERADKMRYDLVYSYYRDDMKRSLDADIHNRKTNPIESMSIAKLVKWMHRYKLKTTQEVLNFLHNKWKPKK